MKVQTENKQYIKEAFGKMKSKEDFLALINYVKVIIYSQKAIPFELKHINYHSNPKTNPKRYFQFSIKKKSGAERIIHAPCAGLKAIQKCLNLIFQAIYEVNPAATGFVPEKSIVDNAKIHTGSFYVYNIDLKDFFPSIEAGRIYARFQHPPFNLNEKTGRKELANIITWLCCHEMEVERLDENNQWQKEKKNVLPQGAPTSPTLTNIICQKMDFYLSAVAKRFGLKYSRYADDITFSAMHNVFQKDSVFLKELHRIIIEQHFHIKVSKTRLQKKGYRQEVTGLLVNENPNVRQRYVKQLRMWLYFWETYGYEKANAYFLPQYTAEKGHVKKAKPNMENIIAGKLDYLKMVRGVENQLYVKLRNRYEKVSGKIKKEVLISGNLHLPQQTKAFLNLFNDSDGLKYLTHNFAGDKPEYESFILLCKREYEKVGKEFPYAARSILKRIYEFAFSKKPEWYIRKGKTKIMSQKGWSEPTFVEWYKKKENHHPWKNEKWKTEMVLPFKESIEIRAGNLGRIIDEAIVYSLEESKNNFNFQINSEALNTAEFYTDVDLLGQALIHIFSTIKDMAEKNFIFDISVNYINETLNGGVFKKIVITHINSEATKNSNDPNFVKGDLKTIRNLLWGLCNYEVQAKFPDGYKRKLISTDDPKDFDKHIKGNSSIQIENESSVTGFAHILKFY